MNCKLVAAIPLAVIAAWSQSVFAIPISAVMNLTAFAQIGDTKATNNDSETWAVLLANLAVNASATATKPGSALSVNTSGSGAASWGAGGNSGSVSFDAYGWTVNAGDNSIIAILNDHSLGDDWTYTFTADFNGIFSMNYLVTSTGDKFGLQGWDIDWSGAGGGLNLENAFNPDTSGVFVRDVLAGSTYTVSLPNQANIGSTGGTFAGRMSGRFAFNIAPVPEPASLALLGIGLVGLAASRRRKSN